MPGAGETRGPGHVVARHAVAQDSHDRVTVTEGCTVLLFYFAISGQSGSGPRWGFIEVETTVGLPAAQSRPRMRAVPGADPFFVSRRSCMWISKTQAGDFTVPFGATQTKQTPPHSKKKEPPRNQTRAAREMAGKARQKWRELWRAMVLRTCGELRSSSGCAVR